MSDSLSWDEYSLTHSQAYINLDFRKNFVDLIREAERFLDEAAMRQVWSPIFGILYLCYDLEKEFLPQFRENAEKLLLGLQMAADTKTT